MICTKCIVYLWNASQADQFKVGDFKVQTCLPICVKALVQSDSYLFKRSVKMHQIHNLVHT